MDSLLRKFGPIWGASGIQNFFGEGYAYHKYAKLFGLNLKGLTLTSKTTTFDENAGNMPMKEDGVTPKEFLPRCIYVSPRSWFYGSALNAVALSSPGIKRLSRGWQERHEFFWVSIMAIAQSREERMKEMSGFKQYLTALLRVFPHLKHYLGLQINYSCPSTGHDMEKLLAELVEEAGEHLDLLSELEVPLVPKINVLLPIDHAVSIGEHPHCSGLTISNTIHWDDLPKVGIDRKKIFGSDVSPLIKRGFKQPGGYSGARLLPLVRNYTVKLRAAGFVKHVNAGGGILKPSDIGYLHDAGADSFFLGSITFLRPWQTGPTIRRAYEIFGLPVPY